MTDPTFQLNISTPENVFFNEPIISLIAPGADGYFGILAKHAPFIALLQSGKLEIKKKNRNEVSFMISGGILEVSHNVCKIFVDEIH